MVVTCSRMRGSTVKWANLHQVKAIIYDNYISVVKFVLKIISIRGWVLTKYEYDILNFLFLNFQIFKFFTVKSNSFLKIWFFNFQFSFNFHFRRQNESWCNFRSKVLIFDSQKNTHLFFLPLFVRPLPPDSQKLS